MNDRGKITNQPKAKLPENIDTPTTSQKDNPSDYLNVILSLNNIIPIVTIILFIMVISRVIIMNGLDRYFKTDGISIPVDKIKYIILKIIGIFIISCFILSLIYYFVSSPVFTYSFQVTDIRSDFSLLNIIYSFFFVIAVIVVLLLPVIAKLFDVESSEYLNYFGTIGALLTYSMFLYFIIQNKKLGTDGKIYKMLGLFTFFVALILTIVSSTTGSHPWLYIFTFMMIFFFGLTAILFHQKFINNNTVNDMKWIPETIVDKLLYFLVFLPLRIMYYYPYIFINYIIPGMYSLFLSPTIFIYTLIFIFGLVIMKFILPYFEITFNQQIYLAWIFIYCIMLYTNKLINSSSTFFSMRQGFLFTCLLFIFTAYTFFVYNSGTMPEYLKLYISSFIFITLIITTFIFFYMAKAEQKEFSDCDLYKNIFPPSFTNLRNQEKLNGIIPTLKRTLFAYIAVCVSCYVLIYLSNKLFPMKTGVIGQITGIIIIILILMIFIPLFSKLKGEGNNKYKVSNSFTNFILSLLSFIGELIFYIPCKIHDIIISIASANKSVNRTTLLFIILDILFILLYIYGSYIRKHIYIKGVFPSISEILGISQLFSGWFSNVDMPNVNVKSPNISDWFSTSNVPNVNLKYPISTKEYNMNVSNFIAKSNDKTMNNTERTIYNYSLSFWFNIDTNSPSSSIAYSTYTPILTYGTAPIVMYNYLNQSLIIASRSDNSSYPSLKPSEINDPSGRYTKSKLKVIYESTNIPLQKWNNLVLVYSSSIVDIFINGKLVGSNISVTPTPSEHIHRPGIPQIISLTAGYTNGINGKICNIIYYDKRIGLEEIDRLYVSVKDNNPPIFHSSIL